MKKIFLVLLMLLFVSNIVYAGNFPSSRMKRIPAKGNPVYNQTAAAWEYTKKKNAENTFGTGCDYNFLYKKRLIGYSNSDLKFYEFIYNDGSIDKKELSSDEIQELYPSYKIIKLSDFSKTTCSLKIKKHIKNLKLVLLSDENYNYDDYIYTSGNTDYKTYKMLGFIDIRRKGMVHFSSKNGNSEQTPWYVLLVR